MSGGAEVLLTLLWGEPEEATAATAGLSGDAWQALDRLAADHRLRPLLASRVRSGILAPPAETVDRWRIAREQTMLRAMRQRAALAQIGRRLGDRGIAVVALKGASFVWSDGCDASLRPMRDLDLLLSEERLHEADALLREAGMVRVSAEQDERAKHLPALRDRTLGVTVELHRHVLDILGDKSAERATAFRTAAMTRTVPLAIEGVPASVERFAGCDRLVHVIAHGVHDNLLNSGPLLLFDIATLVRAGGIDWAQFWRSADEAGLLRAAQLALLLAEETAGVRGIEWHDHRPELEPAILQHAKALMLADRASTLKVGWIGRLGLGERGELRQRLGTQLRRRMTRDRDKPAPALDAASPANPIAASIAGAWKSVSSLRSPEARAQVASALKVADWLGQD